MSKTKFVKRYIEQKTRRGVFLEHGGPAFITEATLSRTRKTVYVNSLELKQKDDLKYGTHFDLRTGDEYLIQ